MIATVPGTVTIGYSRLIQYFHRFILAALVVPCFVQPATAQSFAGLAVTGGAPGLNGDPPPNGVFVSRPSWAVRAVGGLELADGVHLLAEPGIGHRRAGAEYRVADGPVTSGAIGRSELKITHVALSVGFRIQSTNDNVYVTSLISAGHLIDARYAEAVPEPFSSEPELTPEEDALPNLNPWDATAGLAVGVLIPVGRPRISVEVGWTQSLVNVTNTDSQPVDWVFPRRFKFSGFALTAGVEFDLGSGRDEGEER